MKSFRIQRTTHRGFAGRGAASAVDLRRSPSLQRMPSSVSRALGSLLVLCATAGALASDSRGQHAGFTNAEPSVNDSGAANYSVPIAVTPGTRGLQPKLSIRYNSQGGNGPLGIGFALGGLSVISRVASTYAQDNSLDPVDFDSRDRFAFDGERLVNVSGGYGANGTQYRTEQETFTKVVSYGRQGAGPAYFRAWLRNGQIADFGTTADSRVEAPGRADVLFWRVSRISDRFGNYLTIRYFEDRATGESLPTRIDYTGNTVKRTAPYASVRFGYQYRSDRTESFLSGSRMYVARRLNTIRCYYGGSLTRGYNIVYTHSAPAYESRVRYIQELGTNGQGLEPIYFTWGSDGSTAATSVAGSSTFGYNQGYRKEQPREVADVNGDGRADVVAFSNGGPYVALGQSNGRFGAPRRWGSYFGYSAGGWRTDRHPRLLADVNADGKADIVGFAGHGVVVSLSTGSSFGAPRTWVSQFGYSQGWRTENHPRYMADVNGDGRADVVGFASRGVMVSVSTGNGFLPARTWVGGYGSSVGWGKSNSDYPRMPVDVNGDGRADIVGFAGHGVVVSLSTGTAFSAAQTWVRGYGRSSGGWQSAYHPRMLADVNGDGLNDVVGFASSGVYVSLSMGTAFSSARRWYGGFGYSAGGWRVGTHPRRMADMDGDGRADVVGFANAGVYVARSNGNVFTGAVRWSSLMGASSGWRVDRHPRLIGDVDGDGKADVVGFANSGTNVARNNVGDTRHRVIRVAHTGREVNFDYLPLTDSNVYAPLGAETYPNLSLRAPVYVVRSVRSSTGRTLTELGRINYRYEGAVVNLHGRGFRGFKRVTVDNVTTGIRQVTTYDRSHGCVGAPVRSVQQRLISGNRLLSNLTNTVTCVRTFGNRVYRAFVSRSVSIGYELSGRAASSATVSITQDAYGNTTRKATTFTGGHTKTESATFYNNGSTWLIGRPLSMVVASRRNGMPTLTKTTQYAYDSSYIRLIREVQEPNGGSARRLENRYSYDAFGNQIVMTKVAHNGSAMESRTDRKVFDPTGRFELTTSNALGHTVKRTFDPRTGNVLTLTDANGIRSTSTYDVFGRKVTEAVPGHGTTSFIYRRYRTSYFAYSVQTVKAGSPSKIAYYDILDRKRNEAIVDFYGRWVWTQTAYDVKGQAYAVSQPYVSGVTPKWTIRYHDAIGRVVRTVGPDGRSTYQYYDRLTTRTRNPAGQNLIETRDVFGNLTSTTDHYGKQTRYYYDSHNNMVTLLDASSYRRTMTYDVLGRKTALTDPDTGRTTYAHNGFGELISERSARGHTTRYTYDRLGRRTRRIEVEGTTIWAYDAGRAGRGKLYRVTSPGGFQETHLYDAYGREITTQYRDSVRTHSVHNAYDGYGRLYQTTYPTGFRTRNIYTSYGHLTQVRDGATNALYWLARARDLRGLLTHEQFGNGRQTYYTYETQRDLVSRIYTPGVQDLRFGFDGLGNLAWRQDAARRLTERFTYDALNRLRTARVDGRSTVSMSYDAIGNMTYRSDVGRYTYGEGSAGAHAASSIRNASNTVVRRQSYDASGNMVVNGGLRLDYTSYQKPWRIRSGSKRIEFKYGGDRQRWEQRVYNGTSLTEYRRYVGALYERVQRGSSVEHVHYIRTANRVIAVKRTGAKNDLRYLHRDHLGSVQTITSSTGAVQEVLSYDAWGQRRNAGSWTPAARSSNHHRGFGGHEHLSLGSLVHMNGRVYDPTLGRFLSADPMVQKGDGQQLNRYSYTLNNPLSFVDPSGFFFKKLFRSIKKIFKKIWKPLLAIVVGVVTGGWALGILGLSAGSLAGAIVSGAVGGFFSTATTTLLNGGSLGDALKAGLTGAVFGALTGAVLHGLKVGVHKLANRFLDHNSQLYYVHKDAAGNWIYEAVDEIKGPRLFVNGIQSPVRSGVYQGVRAFNGQSFTLFHNPTQGVFLDLLESAYGKLIGPTGQAQNLARFLSNAPGLKEIVAHSQGGIILTNALELVAANGGNLAGVTVTYVGAAVHEGVAWGAARSVEATWGGFHVHPGDLVPTITGLNGNPYSFIRSLGLWRTVQNHSMDSYWNYLFGSGPGFGKLFSARP